MEVKNISIEQTYCKEAAVRKCTMEQLFRILWENSLKTDRAGSLLVKFDACSCNYFCLLSSLKKSFNSHQSFWCRVKLWNFLDMVFTGIELRCEQGSSLSKEKLCTTTGHVISRWQFHWYCKPWIFISCISLKLHR